MKSKPKTLISIACLILLVVVLVLGWGIVQKTQFDAASQQLAIDTTQAFFRNENSRSLVENAHPSYLSEMSEQALNNYLNYSQRRLGPLSSIEAIRGSSVSSLIPFSSEAPTARYEIDLSFNQTATSAVMDLIYEQDKWQFTSFVIESELLAE